MAGTFIFRQILRSPASAAVKTESFFHLQYRCFVSAAVKEETHELTERNKGGGGKSKGKWVTLPPFTSTVDGASLGRRISRRNIEEENESVETTTSALKWVLRCCPHLPQSLVQKLFRLRQVRRNCLEGDVERSTDDQEFKLKRVGARDLMKKGERIFLPLSVQGTSPVKKQKCECSEEEMNFIRGLVLYKDSAIIAINKPPKLPVQGGIGIRKSLDDLAATCLRYDIKDPPRLVHRLDRDSSGILVMGRTQTSTAILHSVFREKTNGVSENDEIDWGKRVLQKRYLALVFGVPKHVKGLISVPLAKVVLDDGKSERITIADKFSPSQHAMTEYRVIETSSYGFTWLELCPVTGRKHQLRVHCAEVLGTPIVGDYKYGWQAHRRWEPLPPSPDEKYIEEKVDPLGLNSECGSISEKQPHLHLHCKQMILPNISLALKNFSFDSELDISKLESVNLVAPLPLYMQRSWDLLKFLAQQNS